MRRAGIRNTTINHYIKNTFTLAFTLILTFPKRPEDRRVALVALWSQSRSKAETEGEARRTNKKQEQELSETKCSVLTTEGSIIEEGN